MTQQDATFWILTGMSGAGKQSAVSALESAGVTCIDNLPVPLLEAAVAHAGDTPQVAVIDSRQALALSSLSLRSVVRVLYLDAGDDVLARRLSESTRRHPMAAAGNLRAQIHAERVALEPLRAIADVVIDTEELTPVQLGERVLAVTGTAQKPAPRFRLVISSFGVKYGPAAEADWSIDVRFLRNPFWEPGLRPLTGLDAAVATYVLQDPAALELIDRLAPLMSWTVARNCELGRASLHLAVGCTGGRHRSVAIAEALSRRLTEELGAGVTVETRHRDVDKPDNR